MFWYHFLEMMRTDWKEARAATYMAETYFFKLPMEVAAAQYRLSNAPPSLKDVICAFWWSSYARGQPGSASGTQSLESYNAHDWRGSFRLPTGAKQERMSPDAFLTCLAAAVKQHGRQLEITSSTTLPDRPTGTDPTSCNSSKLGPVGRSTAFELLRYHRSHDHVIHKVELPSLGSGWVMPRSLLWKPAGEWEPTPSAKLETSADMATACADMAITCDFRALRKLWKEAGILFESRPSVWRFNERAWYRLRYHRVVVMGPEAASKLWRNVEQGIGLCPCTSLALWGRCEHEQCALACDGQLDLSVVGNQRRGRPCKPRWARGAPNREVFSTSVDALPPGSLTAGHTDAGAVRFCAGEGLVAQAIPEASPVARGPYALAEYATDFALVEGTLAKHGVDLPPNCKV